MNVMSCKTTKNFFKSFKLFYNCHMRSIHQNWLLNDSLQDKQNQEETFSLTW